MASLAVQEKVEALIGNPWNGITVITPNTSGEVPADASRFLTIQYPLSDSEQVGLASVGNRNYREEGVIRLVLSVKKGEGNREALTLCETLRTLFRGYASGDFRCWEASPPVENNDNEDGNYYVLSVAIPYYFDVIA